MSIEAASLAIPDVKLLKTKKHHDERGHFVETYSQAAFAQIGICGAFVQDNQSLSIHRATIRGLHYQAAPHAQAKLVRVLKGAAFDVAVDLRRGSSTYGRWCGTILSAEEGHQTFLPVGFAHAFCTLEPNTIVAYKVDRHYAPECEGGLRWNDPDIAIAWPIAAGDVHISAKDAQLPFMREFCSPFALQP